jgi:hypothetical protein
VRRFAIGIVIAVAAGLLSVMLYAALSSTAPSGPGPQELVGLRWLKPLGTEAAYAGDESCRPCHAAEFRSHRRTPHANTLHDVSTAGARTEFRSPETITDPLNHVSYSVQVADRENWLLANTGGQTQRVTPRWAFGAGTEAFSYLGEHGSTPGSPESGWGPDRFLEFRTTYYVETRDWDFTPGRGPTDPLILPAGHPYTDLQAAACFGCHSTVLVGTPKQLALDRSRLNVGCEACHGPGKAHVDSALHLTPPAPSAGGGENSAIVRPPHLSAKDVNLLCTNCHRRPIEIPPGMPENRSELPRFPGRALPRSRCFQESQGQLSCVTCHNPHAPATDDPDSYVRACKSCHTAPHGTPCALKKESGCVSCHMPLEAISGKIPLRFHNHWIRAEIPEVELRKDPKRHG